MSNRVQPIERVGEDDELSAPRALAWRMALTLRETARVLSTMAGATRGSKSHAAAAAEFSGALSAVVGDVESVAERVELASDTLLGVLRGEAVGDEPRNAATLLADGEAVAAPDSLALAFLIEAVDVGDTAVAWQRAEAARALAWLIRRNATASALLRGLADDAVDLTDARSLVDSAKARV